MDGWVKKTSDVETGCRCSLPVFSSKSTLLSCSHEHDLSVSLTKLFYVPNGNQTFTTTLTNQKTDSNICVALEANYK